MLHRAKPGRKLSKNNRPTEAHGARFYPAPLFGVDFAEVFAIAVSPS
jgi:hypothetical protein